MGMFLWFAALTVAGFFWSGFVFSTLWGWFMVPLGVQAISVFHAAGINYLACSLLGSRGIDFKNEDKRPATERYTTYTLLVLLLPALCLFGGWLARLGM